MKAGDGIRTRDINLGKVTLYQLSHSRITCYLSAIKERSSAEKNADGGIWTPKGCPNSS